MLYLILFIALLLRLININQSLWLDEAINLNNVNALSFGDLIFKYSLSDFHPPLYHIILKGWSLIVPLSEFFARFLSVIFAVATVYVTYLIAKKLYEEKTALIVALLLTTAPLHIYYSQEARMYMMAAFFTSLSVYFFLKLLEKDNIKNWTGFIVATTLMLYSDYLPYLMIPAYFFYILIFRKKISKNSLKGFIPAFLLILFLIIPWLLILPDQLKTGLSAASASPAWSDVVGSSQIKDLGLSLVKFTIGRISSDNNLIYALLFAPAGIYVFLLFLLSLFRLSPKRLFLWVWLLFPLLSAFLISYFVPIFAYFRFIFVLPAFYLIWASAINTVNINKITVPLLLFATSINLISTFIYYLNPKFQRENWRDAVSYIHQNAKENSIVLFESNYTTGPFDYYNNGMVEASGGLDSFSADSEQVKENVENLTKTKDQVFLFQYLSGVTDPNGILFEEIINKGFKNTSTVDFAGVGFVYEFNR
ncbi:hypothetical protein A3J17_02795 [Candidatus Curtissbacteria bacterium RIFCSPLOWO2_02_FULL_40_11]|uniref:Glycosyltransferase RgtA/B/C/D-like domain-containing protein n=1 Tax=Candidatus Curtissbacteria bacterium RIFCSPLOWO2_12_FULL_38_9 TaxID=1797735 RepID=A0A1F5I8W1_9BACT|nr:MAG: hypothetical protein A3J17_02795 [Candidatus Curtissbacteria bacterium RIFCSPLOWO2_02_FULL_40_11]OGE12709.1 MAG: hypothetical protein A3G14_00725 [Candidatus Curtissbacteria bacterium RIFCSPLOWO2_12_FULL_38_9]